VVSCGHPAATRNPDRSRPNRPPSTSPESEGATAINTVRSQGIAGRKRGQAIRPRKRGPSYRNRWWPEIRRPCTGAQTAQPSSIKRVQL